MGTLNRWSREWFRKAPRLAGLAVVVWWGLAPAWAAAADDAAGATVLRVTPAGEWLAKFLDGLDVEHRWLSGHDHVAWKSGHPLAMEHGKPLTPLARNETHCSAFAAAAADALGGYLLHPPEHSHVLLANAQYDWLPSAAGQKAGWTAVATALTAQEQANRGELVVAVFKNPVAEQPGHVAIVRPTKLAAARVQRDGPQVTQAGFTNYRSIDLKTGFMHHPGAWTDGGGAVKFYAHAVDAKRLAGE